MSNPNQQRRLRNIAAASAIFLGGSAVSMSCGPTMFPESGPARELQQYEAFAMKLHELQLPGSKDSLGGAIKTVPDGQIVEVLDTFDEVNVAILPKGSNPNSLVVQPADAILFSTYSTAAHPHTEVVDGQMSLSTLHIPSYNPGRALYGSSLEIYKNVIFPGVNKAPLTVPYNEAIRVMDFMMNQAVHVVEAAADNQNPPVIHDPVNVTANQNQTFTAVITPHE